MNPVMSSDRNLGLITRIYFSDTSSWYTVRSHDGVHARTTDYLEALRMAQMQARTVPGLTTVSVDGVVLDSFAMLVVV